MEVKFNGKLVKVSDIGEKIGSVIINNIVSSSNTDLSKCFGDAYVTVLKSRFDTSKGVATKSLINSIKYNTESFRTAKVSNERALISMVHKMLFNEYGFYVGAEKFKTPKKNPSKEAINRMTEWVRAKNGSFNFGVKDTEKSSREEKIARIILFSWVNGVERKVVLPKWYNVLKDGDDDVIKALLSNSKCIENSIKNMMK